MDLLSGHLSILAWKRMLAICKLRLSLSMAVVGLFRGVWRRAGQVSTGRLVVVALAASNCFLLMPFLLSTALVAALVAGPYLDRPYLILSY